jgi:hypothetical protein
MTTINFAIDNPLVTLEQDAGLGPSPGTVTGGPGGSIANNTITSINLAPGAAVGNLTPNSVPGADIINNSITNTQLAPGAAAANINAGPAGSINSSQIAGGPFLPLSGGTMTGEITQSLPPVAGTDLANKAYVDGVLSTPGSIPGTSITNNSITSTQLAPGAAAGNLTPNSVPGADIVNNSITSTQLAPGAAVGNLTPNSIPGADIVNGSITTTQIAPGTILGSNIAAGTVTDANLAPGPANTIKGTNSLSAVDDFVLGPSLALTAGAGPTLSVNATALGKAGNTQFGVIEFDPSGDLMDSGVNTGIAKLKQPANQTAGNPAVVSLGFNSLGTFVATPPVFSSNFAQPRGTPITVGNLQFQVPVAGQISTQMKYIVPGGTGTNLNGQWWNNAATITPGTSFKTTFNTLTNVQLATFQYLSPDATWTNGNTEFFILYVNDGVDDAVYRVTTVFFNPDAIVVERLSA